MGPHEAIQVEKPSKQRDLRIRNSREKLPAFMPKLCVFRGALLLLSFTKVTLSTTAGIMVTVAHKPAFHSSL